MKNNKTGKNIIKKAAALAVTAGLVLSLGTAVFAAGDNISDSVLQSAEDQLQSSEMGTPPAPPDGNGAPPDGGMGGPGGSGGPGGGSSGVDSYDAVNEFSEDTEITGETIVSTGTDENAVLVSGGSTVISGSTITRTSSDSTGGDNSSFYGVGAAILATDGTVYVTGSDITTDAAGGAGVFAYGDGVAYVADTTITTSQNTSGGIHAAGGGTLYAWNVTATTDGGSAAAIRSDRGGGTMVIDGGTYTSNGSGSPAIYCTADISVNDAVLTATGSEAVCIEGLNSLALYDCDLTGSMPEDSQNDCTWTVIVYQSMSGDSEVGCGTFQMQGGSLTSTNGGIFYTTNTESNFFISGVDITAAEDSGFFLKVTGNANQRGWGSTGSNGADCVFTASDQEADGDIIWDSISTLDFYLVDGSTLTGAVIDDESCAGSGGSGYANLYIDSSSTWIVTADSELTNLYNAGTITDADGKTVTVKDTSGNILIQGDSSITVTVSSYSESADTSGMVTATSWSDVSVTRPEELGEAQTEEAAEVQTEAAEVTQEETTEAEEQTETVSSDAEDNESETAAEAENDQAAADTQQESSGISAGALIGIIAGAAAVVAVICVIIAKSRKKMK